MPRIQNKIPCYATWRKIILKRDNYTCQICHKEGREAHHILSVKERPDLILNFDNGITLCVDCHKLQHRRKTNA